jgi:hypothetical protein
MSIADYIYNRYIALKDKEECKVCSKLFSNEDLLQEKVHKTCWDHFFHKACLDKAPDIKSSFCKSCQKPWNYDVEVKEWQNTLEKIRKRIQSKLQPLLGREGREASEGNAKIFLL